MFKFSTSRSLFGLLISLFGGVVFPIVSGQAASAPPINTGQIKSYSEGDDGNVKRGVAWPSPRFTDNNNGTVTDNLNGLIWLKDANCFGLQTWPIALTSANTLASGMCTLTDGSQVGDWHLPSYTELLSLIDYGRFSPALPTDHLFSNVQSSSYWSSSTRFYKTGFAWSVYFPSGSGGYSSKTDSTRYVWPVRGGQD